VTIYPDCASGTGRVVGLLSAPVTLNCRNPTKTRNLGSETVTAVVYIVSMSEFACSFDLGIRGAVQGSAVVRLSEFICSSVPS